MNDAVKEMLRKRSLTFNQTIEKLEKENKLLNEQNQKLINEHEKVFNISFDAIFVVQYSIKR